MSDSKLPRVGGPLSPTPEPQAADADALPPNRSADQEAPDLAAAPPRPAASEPEAQRTPDEERADVRLPRISPLITARAWNARETEANGGGASGPAPADQAVGASGPPPAKDAPARPRDVPSLEERLKPRGPLAPVGMSDRGRFIVATLFGMVLAVGVHIAIVLAMPRFAEHDAFSRLRSTMESGNAVPIATAGGANTWMPQPDPAAVVAACAYDLRDGPVRVSAKTGTLFQSLSFHSRGGGVYFAVTDRAAVRGELDLVVMTRRQLDEALAAEDESEPTRDVRIIAPRPEGFAIIRVLAPAPSLRSQAEEAAKAVSCTIESDQADEPGPPAPASPPPPPPPAQPQVNRPPAAAPAAPPRR